MPEPNVTAMYEELVKKGLDPKDAAKQVQARTGYSVVTGRPIERKLYNKFSTKRPHNVIGQYGS